MNSSLRQVKSCGVLLFRRSPQLAFLLMKHANRYDLPKGQLEPGETELACALRELAEETGIAADQVRIDPEFRFTEIYCPRYKRFGGDKVEKTLVIFLGFLNTEVPVAVSEHVGFEWIDWNPPHQIQAETVDPLLAQAAAFIN